MDRQRQQPRGGITKDPDNEPAGRLRYHGGITPRFLLKFFDASRDHHHRGCTGSAFNVRYEQLMDRDRRERVG